MITNVGFDFNVSKIHDYSYYDLIELEKIVGTKNYISPEVERGYYCKASDMYSLGCLLFIVYTRKLYNGENMHLINKLPPNIIKLINNYHQYCRFE